MTIAASGGPPATPAQPKDASRPNGSAAVKPSKGGFAAMLGGAGGGAPLTYRQPDNRTDGAVGFAARPLVAPASVTTKSKAGRGHAPVRHLAKSDDIGPVTTDGPVAEAAAVRREASKLAVPDQRPGETRGAAGDRLSVQRSAGAMDAGIPPAATAPLVQPHGQGGRAAARGATGIAKPDGTVGAALPTTFDLGGGVTIHLAADAANPRVLVRGVRLGAQERGEVTARIVKLLRGYGIAISEQSIEFDEGTNG